MKLAAMSHAGVEQTLIALNCVTSLYSDFTVERCNNAMNSTGMDGPAIMAVTYKIVSWEEMARKMV